MSEDLSVRGYVNPEMADFTEAVIDNFFDKEYFENEYSGRITDYERLKDIEREFYDNLEEALEGLELNFSDVSSLEDFHEALVLEDVYPGNSYRNSVPEKLERKRLIEFRDGKMFYGPLAFPYLQLRSDLRDAFMDEEWFPEEDEEVDQEVEADGQRLEEPQEEKDLQQIFDEVSGGEHVETIEQRDDGGLDTRDHTDKDEEDEDINMDDDAGYEGFT